VHFRLGEERHPRAGDLKGKRIGVPEYQMTAPVWIRGILSDDYGVKVTDVAAFLRRRGRARARREAEDPGAAVDQAASHSRATRRFRMLADGELDALVTAGRPRRSLSVPKT
jgi:4,5-dihydroxyphthalate decarboxylase